MNTYLVEFRTKPTERLSENGGWLIQSTYVQAESEVQVRIKYPTAYSIKRLTKVDTLQD